MNGEGEHWTDSFEHGSITDENRESFNKVMGDYKSIEDAVVGGFEAKKTVGRPFKLPESIDKIPDENMRKEFTAGALKVLGLEPIRDEEGFKEFPWTQGLPEGSKPDEALAAAYKKHVIANGITRGVAEKEIAFYNGLQQQAKQAFTQGRLNQIDETNKTLVEHFKGEENYNTQKELFKRTMQNPEYSGLNAEEAAKVIGDLFDEKGQIRALDPLFVRGIVTSMAMLSKEGTTEAGAGAGAGAGEKKEKSFGEKEGLEKTSKALWGEKV